MTETLAPRPTVKADPFDSSVASRGDGPQHFTGRHLVWLALITLLAAALRFYRLGDWGFWVDEAHTWRDVTMPLWGPAGDGFFDGARKWYPLSYLGLRWLLEAGLLSGMTEGWLRLPFAFCGIVSVPLLALFGQHLVGRRAALLGALFLAVNPWHIYWSQNARAYVAVFFFATLAAGTLWLACARRSWRLWLTAIAAALIGGACHPTGLLLLPVFVAYPVLSRSARVMDRRLLWKVLAVCAAVVVLAQLVRFLPPLQAFAKAKPDASLAHLLQTTAFYFRVPLLLAGLLGVWLLFQTRLQGRALFLACWTLVPLGILALLGASVVKVTARYAFCALPAVMLLAGAGSVRMGEALVQGLRGRGVLGLWLPAALVPAMVCFDMVSYDYLYFGVQRGDRGAWREAAEFVTTSAGGRMTVYTVNEPSVLYYLRPQHFAAGPQRDPYPDRRVVPILPWDVFGPGGERYLEHAAATARSEGRDLYVVVTLPELREMDQDGSLERTLRQRFELAHVLPVWVGPKDETIYLYRPPARR